MNAILSSGGAAERTPMSRWGWKTVLLGICLVWWAAVPYEAPAQDQGWDIQVLPYPWITPPPPPGCKYEITMDMIAVVLTIVYPSRHPKCAPITGDPHVTTFDGVRYDLQAAGEFVGIESLDDDLEVQYRLEPVGRPSRVSFVSAVAARVGDRRIVFAAHTGPRVRIDGEAIDLPDGQMTYLTEERNAVLVRQGARYTVVWPDDSNLHVHFYSSYLNAFFLPSQARDGRLTGLFGDGDGNAANDFRTREGRLLDAPPEFDALYETFAESWRVRPEESLFDYDPGESTDTFTERSVPAGAATIEDLSPADRARAEAACRDAGVTEPEPFEECVIDVGFSGDVAFIASALDQQTPPELASRLSTADRVGPVTYTTGNRRDVHFPLGDRSFADRVVLHEPGGPAPAPGRPNADPRNSLGPPDFRKIRDRSYVSLGVGGSLVVSFTDNVLVDVPGPDLVVFFAGAGVERVTVAISEDGVAFTDVGAVRSAGEEVLDIAPAVRPGARYTHVRVSDVNPRLREEFGDNIAGPDIDAIGAIGAEAP